MKLLALDTTEDSCSVALCVDDEMRWRFQIAPRQHSELILPMMESLLAEAQLSVQQLDALAFSRGPGSFTGIRIATGVAQGVALGAGLPVVPVSTLTALAQAAFRKQGATRVLSALDARMNEVYWAWCECRDGVMRVSASGEQVGAADTVTAEDDEKAWGVGSGWFAYADALEQATGIAPSRVLPEQRVHARDVASLGLAALAAGKTLPPEEALPVYIRDNVAAKPIKKTPLAG
ncbi:tRNA (adenosine(37)-N6)-threonylcarbamoyltransferase complex dimerization subunit type 1 TsaB [Thiolapillus brandeum]|uniref:tRNA threonylcarbamoyladenosine biosynthesis protein TsaB n=1 Tax=Thiolapillus brandeum TaxID=1076588 RepID=A0A7U6GJ02_9GAMM|nr:tRNA (adenosine(37)-N6)-threonylcarbamoyltransferase complex dimerization subunit type 1 TsaB [Thiolapillus brandeum]BAO44524.1 peptidase M22 glycoprotease [Thiolapillus brandeum]